MAISPIPLDEEERLLDLRRLQILDTPEDERFDRITRVARRVFDVPIAVVSFVDAGRQWFKSRIGLEAEETARDISFCAHAIMGDDVLHITDAISDERFRDSPLVAGDPGIRFYAGCPIKSPRGNRLGTLCVMDRRPRELSPEDLETLRDLAQMIEREIATLQLATTDALTLLNNRRGFLLSARQLLRFAKRANEPASLLFIDIDGMKRINDELGHDAGDLALVNTANLMRESLRESDVIARLGGDEFCVLFVGSSAASASIAISRLEEAVDLHNQTQDSGPDLALSVGLADWDPSADETLEQLVKRADRAMYAHKRSKKKRART